jgi:hypothetical protein
VIENPEAAGLAFWRMSRENKIRFLCRLAFELTVVGRDTYIPQTEEISHPAHLRAINELQHHILGYLNALTFDDPRRYPDGVLIAIILEAGKDAEQREKIHEVFERLLQWFSLPDARLRFSCASQIYSAHYPLLSPPAVIFYAALAAASACSPSPDCSITKACSPCRRTRRS